MTAHRPDVLLLATPLAIISAWSVLNRPRGAPDVTCPSTLPVLREGQSLTWVLRVSRMRGAPQATLIAARPLWAEMRPPLGAVTAAAPDHEAPIELRLTFRSTRWGKRPVGRAVVIMTSEWGAFRWGPIPVQPRTLTTLPLPAVFDSKAPAPHPVGLVGLYRSAHQGDGSEFATIRPFHVGDRLRRISWPVSLRTRQLHVTSTYADQDTQVMLIVDASNDVGDSGGVDGAQSSLDLTMRAAGAIGEHYLHHGDRVGLRVFGASSSIRLEAASGQQQLRRLLDHLASVTPGQSRGDLAQATRRIGVGSLVVMLSAAVSSAPLQQAVVLSQRGLAVIVIDTLPTSMASDTDPDVALAWRIRRLERGMEIRRVTAAGVPIVSWHGPGSLDLVLRDLQRRARAPHRVLR
ncbi:MAG: DUF58 domain-containing protein [Nocardioidaceae bacterium]